MPPSQEKDDIGELIIVIGENNVGKSNILDGIAAIKSPKSGEDAPLSESDAPDFMGYEDAKPEIKLVYDDVDGRSCDASYFLDDGGKAQFKTTNLELVDKVIATPKLERKLSQKAIEAIKGEFEAKFDVYKEKIENYCRDSEGTQAKDLAALRKSYNSIIALPTKALMSKS